jgi:serine/threonine-protein kinase
MGVVVAARHLELGELFAIKFLLPKALETPQAVDRFIREARAAARLKGQHVTKVHDVGRLETGAPYMVMEHLEGTDLKAVVRRQGPLPIEDAITFMLQACEAIAEAHRLGIVHRDLKPANLFVTSAPDGAPWIKVLDFGISKQLASEGEHELTTTDMIMGSPLYMSPEQLVRTKQVDPRADIWSLGVVLYELLTATTPFRSKVLTEIVGRVLQEEPAPPSRHRLDLPPALDAIVLRCLEKRVENRFQTTGELAAALRAFRFGASHPGMPLPRPPVASAPVIMDGMIAPVPAAETATVPLPSTPQPPIAAARPALGSIPGGGTASAWGNTGMAPPPPVRSRAYVVAGLVAGMALLGTGGLWLTLRAGSEELERAAASDTPAASSDVSVPPVLSAVSSAAPAEPDKRAPAQAPAPAASHMAETPPPAKPAAQDKPVERPAGTAKSSLSTPAPQPAVAPAPAKTTAPAAARPKVKKHEPLF